MAEDPASCWFVQAEPCQYCNVDLTERNQTLVDACRMVCGGADIMDAADKYGVPVFALTTAMKHADCPGEDD